MLAYVFDYSYPDVAVAIKVKQSYVLMLEAVCCVEGDAIFIVLIAVLLWAIVLSFGFNFFDQCNYFSLGQM